MFGIANTQNAIKITADNLWIRRKGVLMTTEIYLVLFPAIITGIFTLGAVYLTNKQNNHRVKSQQRHEFEISRENIYRDKLEELYTLFNKHSIQLLAHCNNRMNVMDGRTTYIEAFEAEAEYFKSQPITFERLEMLVDLYSPSLRDGLKNYFQARDSIADIIQDHKIKSEQGEIDGEQHYQSMVSNIDHLNSVIIQFKSMIAAQSLPR
ncbi:hypothetical protein [Gimesia maris]|uniref:CHASE3 domain-containing protein n=1 Tax=Gimesia maris TaxID=122 RepID=A0ABX5YPD4_9PLAN|nr:hypothetical protein [Gimesia maris]EDL58366.1 hypothetical protein PM8797T_26960 [Gimesia maris DSM 8797]QEG17539.1 hypothetical protein GmarT_34210 [Gimesia maris]QGQ29397.1 hypothetical protein F1729_12415 [Gimesia maris]